MIASDEYNLIFRDSMAGHCYLSAVRLMGTSESTREEVLGIVLVSME